MDTAPRPRLSTAFWRSLVLSTLLPLLVLSLAFYFYGTRVNERRVLDRLEVASSLTSELLENHIQLHLAAVRAEASKAQDRPPDSAGLERLRALYPSFLTTLRTDALGRVVAVSPPERLQPGASLDVSDREYFRVPAATGQPVVTNGFLGRGLGRDELVAVAAPVWVDGRFDGVVEGSLPVTAFTGVAARGLTGLGLEMLVVGSDGKVIHATSGVAAGFGDALGELLGAPELAQARERSGPVRVPGLLRDGGDARVVKAQVAGDWRLLLLAPEALLAEQRAFQLLYTLLVLLVVGMGLAWMQRLQARRLAASIEGFSDALTGLARPEALGMARLDDLPAELAPAARAVAGLTAQLESSFSELRLALDQQQSLSRSLEQVLAERDAEIQRQTEALVQANARLESLAMTDALCGLLNRRGLEEACIPWTDAERRLVMPLALLAVDIDFFKSYNDTYGHPAGDQVLRRVAAALRAALRDPGDQLARIGGEEFLVLLPGATAELAGVVARRVLVCVREMGIPHVGSPTGYVGVSLGIAAGAPGEAMSDVWARSDAALYRAKNSGRDRLEFSPDCPRPLPAVAVERESLDQP